MLDADERWERGWGRFPERGNSFEGMLQCGGGAVRGRRGDPLSPRRAGRRAGGGAGGRGLRLSKSR